MGKKKPRHKKSTSLTLTKEIAGTLCQTILDGGALFTAEEYKNNTAIEIPVKDGVFLLKPETYRQWMKRRIVVPDSGKTLYQQINEARHERRMKKHEEDKKELVVEAQKHLKALQKLPLGTETRRVLKKSRVIEGGRMMQTHQEDETISTPVDPRMVKAKTDGSKIVLEALDPAFKKKDGATMNVMVNLGDLRKEKESRDEQPKQVPKEDYEVKE